MNFFHFIITIILSFFATSPGIPVNPPVSVQVEVASDTPVVASQEAPQQAASSQTTLRVNVVAPSVVGASTTDATSTPPVPIVIYVQVPQPPASPAPAETPSVQSPIISSVPTPMPQAPQFSPVPSFTKNVDGSMTTVVFGSDIPATAVFYLGDQPTPGDDLDAYTPINAWVDTFTGFIYDFGSYSRPVFYAVKITANGVSTIKKGQVLAMPHQQ